jgi:DNA-binding NtrC family response regulator
MTATTNNSTDTKDALRILVVGHDASLHDVLRDQLSAWGFEVQTVASDQQLELVRSFEPQVLIIDVDRQRNDLPGILRDLEPREIEFETIVMASEAELDDIIRTLEPGTYDFISKPINPIRLQIMMNRLSTQLVGTRPSFEVRLGASLDELEREFILKTLDFTQGNKVRAAQVLGISLKTLYNRLARYHGKARPPAGDSPINPENN